MDDCGGKCNDPALESTVQQPQCVLANSSSYTRRGREACVPSWQTALRSKCSSQCGSTATKSNSFCRFCKLSHFLEILRVAAVFLVGFGFRVNSRGMHGLDCL